MAVNNSMVIKVEIAILAVRVKHKATIRKCSIVSLECLFVLFDYVSNLYLKA